MSGPDIHLIFAVVGIVPFAGARDLTKRSFNFSPEFRKPTLGSANNLRRLCGSSGVKPVIQT
jgi:hypothetical protein